MYKIGSRLGCQVHATANVAEFVRAASDKAAALSSPDATQRSSATELAQWWDRHKTELRKRLRREYKRARQAMTSSYWQRLVRLLERLDSARTTHNETRSTAGSKVSELRAQVARCRLERQRQKRERLMRSHLHRPDDTSKRFFARVSTKYSDNTIIDLGGNAGQSPTRSQELAEDMADGWRPIMQRATIDTSIARDFLAASKQGTTTLLTDSLSASITEDEVAVALKKCKRRKACGPDELGNDFYRDHAELLTPILTRLYNYWFHAGVAPTSFETANIQCLRKSTYAVKPLDHRPIALLNTDYKVYTKVFASRLRRLLPALLDSAQTGFVPGRSIATAIDSLLAAQRVAPLQEESTKPVAILLDIAKVYDSIQRPFLLEALRWTNLPERFVAMVELLHTATSSRFIVNGYLSRPITVASGIRQGCPLAPLLFVIALDPLHRSLRACEHFDGIVLGTAEQSFELKNCGYADDTAIYCSDAKQIEHALGVMDAFSAVSGLHVNRSKSIILPLKGTTEIGHATIHDIRVLTADEHCRYLGIEVGPADTCEANWVACLHSLRTRLALVRAKTHTVEQRVRLAATTVVPKVMFVARNSWPAQATINLLHDLIKKFVWGARSRPWVPERQSQLSQALDGLGVPDIESELIVMSTHAVGRWATNATPYERLLGDILQNRSGSVPVYTTPLVTTPQRQRPVTTMWQTGTSALQRLLRDRVLGDDAQTLTSRAFRFVAVNTGDHHPDGSYLVNVGTEMSGLTANELLSAERRSGQFDQRWLERASITPLEWLRDARGNHYKLTPSLIPTGATVLADIVRWTWVQHGTTRFYPAQDMTHATSARRRVFARFCVALASNFPRIMCRPVLPGTVTSFNRAGHEQHEWTLTEQGAILKHHKHGFLSHTYPVATMHECESVVSSHVPEGNAQPHSHPLLTRIVNLWHGHVQWQPRRATIRGQVRACLTTLGEAQRDSACERGDHSDLLNGLDMLEWRDTQRVFATNAYVAQSLFRLKANRFPLWNRAAGNLSCPHNGCSDTMTATVKHIFWECSAAQRWWSNLTASWSRLGIDLGSDAITWIFGLGLPNAPQQAWNAVAASPQDAGGASDIQQHLLGCMNVIWRAQVAESIHGNWNERLRLIEDAERDVNIWRVITVATHQRVLRRIRALAVQPLNRDATAADKMTCALADFLLAQAEPADILPAPKTASPSSVFILFFDGGSRGNPGPGGSGSTIVRVSPNSRQATTIRVASMAYGNRRTTNNVAECRGLRHGLRHPSDMA